MTQLSYREIPDAIARRENFDGNSLSGRAFAPTAFVIYGTGYLPAEHRHALQAVQAHVTYVVSSYGTPIAWVLDDGTVTVPDVKYSRTTCRGQHLTRLALKGI